MDFIKKTKKILCILCCLCILAIATGCNKNTLSTSDVKKEIETRHNVIINSIEKNEIYEDYDNLVSSYKIITNDEKEFYAGVKKITIGGFEADEYEVVDNYNFIELRKQINSKYNNVYWENYFLNKEIKSNDISALSWTLQIKLNNENEINSIFLEYQDILNIINNLNLEDHSLISPAIVFLCDENKGKTNTLENGKKYFSQEFYIQYLDDLDEPNKITLEQLRTEYYSFCK